MNQPIWSIFIDNNSRKTTQPICSIFIYSNSRPGKDFEIQNFSTGGGAAVIPKYVPKIPVPDMINITISSNNMYYMYLPTENDSEVQRIGRNWRFSVVIELNDIFGPGIKGKSYLCRFITKKDVYRTRMGGFYFVRNGHVRWQELCIYLDSVFIYRVLHIKNSPVALTCKKSWLNLVFCCGEDTAHFLDLTRLEAFLQG